MPTRLFYTVAELGQHWSVDLSQIWQWLIDGKLPAHAQLPLMSVFRLGVRLEDGVIHQTRELQHWQGHAVLSRFHCMRLFQTGKLTLREILCKDNDSRFIIPDEADDLVVLDHRVVIFQEEKANFEEAYGSSVFSGDPYAANTNGCERDRKPSALDPSFRSIKIDGEIHYFGEMQSAILRALYDAAKSGAIRKIL